MVVLAEERRQADAVEARRREDPTAGAVVVLDGTADRGDAQPASRRGLVSDTAA